jgi:WD40 repeat protein
MSREVRQELEVTRREICNLDDFINSLSFSFDGQFLASASVSGKVGIHGIDGDGELFQAHRSDVSRIAYSPVAHEFATAGIDGVLRIWRGPGRLMAEVSAKGWCTDIAWRPTGGEVAAAVGKRVIRALSNGMKAVPHQELGTVAECVSWSSCGRKLFVGAYGGVWMFQGAPNAIKTFPWKGAPLTLRISPDDKWIATGNQDSSLHCWKISNGSDLQMTGFETKVQHIAWDESSTHLANASFSTISIWDFSGRGPKGTTPTELNGHSGRIIGLGYLPSFPKVLVSAATDGGVCIWSPRKSGQSLVSRFDTGLSLSAMAISPRDAVVAVGSEDGEVLVLDVRDLQTL